MNKFIFLCTGYNSGRKLLQECLESIKVQMYKNYRVLLIDDASTDESSKIINELRDNIIFKDFTYIERTENKGILYNKTMPLLDMYLDDEDIIVILDSDDSLYSDYILDYLDIIYEDKSIWFTYGTLVGNKSGVMRNFCQPIPPGIPIRKLPWITSQLKTVKWFVYKNVLAKDLLDMNGNVFRATSDLAMFWPIIEMIGTEHIKFVPEKTYWYNENTGNNVHTTNRQYQLECEAFLRNKTPYKLKTELELKNHICDWRTIDDK